MTRWFYKFQVFFLDIGHCLAQHCHHHIQFHSFHWSPTHENNKTNMLLSNRQFFIGIADHKTAPTNTSPFCQHCLQSFPRIFFIQIRIKHIERTSRVLSWLLVHSIRGDWQSSTSCWANVKTRLNVTNRNFDCRCLHSWLVSQLENFLGNRTAIHDLLHDNWYTKNESCQFVYVDVNTPGQTVSPQTDGGRWRSKLMVVKW